MAEPKTIGILGGMGPAATVDLFDKLVRATDAATDQDHLRILIDNNPRIPNRNDAIAGRGPSPVPALIAGARGLEREGADCILISCNTAHFFAPEIGAALSIPILNMIEATVDATKARGVKRAGVMAGTGCIDAQLYQNALERAGIEPVTHDPEEQKRMMALIYRIKGGDMASASRAEARALAAVLIARGAEAIIAGCTEAPLVLFQRDISIPLLNSTDILVERAIAFASA
ncbi:aspartate racemase [alpha proteobacterium U9-1i]|nr:aspartate racemase [alpha proteobacterium U9-1i]